MRVTVREGVLSDTPDLARLWLAMSAEKQYQNPDVDGWLCQQFQSMATGTVLVAVAVAGGRAVGFADGSLAYEPGTRETGLVGRHLFVASEHRGTDLGGRLMLRLLSLARQCGSSYLLTHGGPSAKAVERFLGKEMEAYATIRIARW